MVSEMPDLLPPLSLDLPLPGLPLGFPSLDMLSLGPPPQGRLTLKNRMMPLVLFIRVCIDLDIAALEGLVYPSRRRTSFTGLSCTMGNGIMTQLLPRLQTRITEEEWLVYKAIPALALLLRFSVVVSRLRASRKRSMRTSTL